VESSSRSVEPNGPFDLDVAASFVEVGLEPNGGARIVLDRRERGAGARLPSRPHPQLGTKEVRSADGAAAARGARRADDLEDRGVARRPGRFDVGVALFAAEVDRPFVVAHRAGVLEGHRLRFGAEARTGRLG
jgi:hypothetical protein